jgi:hypothetical protein
MEMPYSAAAETVARVVEQLAVSPRPLKDRLLEASAVLQRLRDSGPVMPEVCRATLERFLQRSAVVLHDSAPEPELIDLALEVVRLERDLWHLAKQAAQRPPN